MEHAVARQIHDPLPHRVGGTTNIKHCFQIQYLSSENKLVVKRYIGRLHETLRIYGNYVLF